MILTTDDVITRFRNEVDDIIRGTDVDADNDALWKSDEVLGYLVEAVAQTASETLSLYKTFDLPFLAADGPYVRLPSGYELIDINNVYLVTGRQTLRDRNLVEGVHNRDDYGFYGGNEGWENAVGRPVFFTRDFRPGYLRLYPAPSADDTLRITAVVGACEVTSGMPMPFQHPKDIRLILHWMKYLAYGKKDVDTFDPDAQRRFKNDFDAQAHERKYECLRIRRAPSTTRFSW